MLLDLYDSNGSISITKASSCAINQLPKNHLWYCASFCMHQCSKFLLHRCSVLGHNAVDLGAYPGAQEVDGVEHGGVG
jgi:hypothetical protein